MATYPLVKSPLVKALQDAPEQVAKHEGWELEAEGASAGHIGIKADALRIRRATPAKRDAPTLAKELAEHARYLLEPLEVVESDAQQAVVRSRDPKVTEEGCDYYELWVRPDEVSVERYQGQKGQPREPRPLHMTWEQAERLANDITATYDADAEE